MSLGTPRFHTHSSVGTWWLVRDGARRQCPESRGRRAGTGRASARRARRRATRAARMRRSHARARPTSPRSPHGRTSSSRSRVSAAPAGSTSRWSSCSARAGAIGPDVPAKHVAGIRARVDRRERIGLLGRGDPPGTGEPARRVAPRRAAPAGADRDMRGAVGVRDAGRAGRFAARTASRWACTASPFRSMPLTSRQRAVTASLKVMSILRCTRAVRAAPAASRRPPRSPAGRRACPCCLPATPAASSRRPAG
jgi:hypothetical protein